MSSRFLTLLWLHGRRTWGFILFGLAAPLLVDVFFWATWYWESHHQPLDAEFGAEAASILSFFGVLMATVLIATLGAEDRGLLSLPRYLMPFPASNVLLSNAYFVYSALVSAGLAYARAGCHYLLLGPHVAGAVGVTLPAWQIALLLLAVCTLAQVANALLSGSGRASAPSLGLVLVFPACVLVGTILVFIRWKVDTAYWIALAPASYLATHILTSFVRRGIRGTTARAVAALTPKPGKNRGIHFTSPRAALAWYEWKRFGRYFPLICGLTVLVPSIAAAFSAKWLDDALGTAMFAVLGTSIFLSAYMTIQRYRDHVSGFAQFVFTKPCSTTTIASARARMLIRSSIDALFVMALLLGVAFLPHFLAEASLLEIEPKLLLSGELLLSGGILLFATWLALSFAIPLFYIYLAAMLFVAPMAAMEMEGLVVVCTLLPVAFVALIILLVMAWKRYRPSLSTFLLMILVAIVTMAGTFVISVDNGNSWHGSLVLSIVISPCPLLPIAVAPFTIDWYRHR